MKIRNTFWFRHFLMCDAMAKECCHGLKLDNSARLIDEANSQMTKYFWYADSIFSTLSESDKGEVFESLEEEDGITMLELTKLTRQELEEYFHSYCIGLVNQPNNHP